MPRQRYIALSRPCTRTTSRTSIECTRDSSRSRLNRRGALNTGCFTVPVRNSSARRNASSTSLFCPRLSLMPATMISTTWGERISYNQALCVPSSRHRCLRPGIRRRYSTSAVPVVSTTSWRSFRPLGPITPNVQLVPWASNPMYRSTGVLPLWRRYFEKLSGRWRVWRTPFPKGQARSPTPGIPPCSRRQHWSRRRHPPMMLIRTT